MNNENPLFGEQREKAGSKTFEKYLYQYHWALYRIFKEHEEGRDYAIFIELHEDVVLANSLDVKTATFEFNQVKTNKTKFTEASLSKLKNGSSVFGKLIDSSATKEYADKITDINLVATSGFNKDFLQAGITLKDICIDDIPNITLTKLSDSITKELDIKYFPINIHLITPELPDTNSQQSLIGYISEVVSKLFPDSLTHAVNIYRPLIDELKRKGIVTDDFKNWDKLLENKALTSITVGKVINEFTQRKNDDKIFRKLNTILDELGYKTMQKTKYEKSFGKYYLNRIGNKTIGQLDIRKAIEDNLNNCDDEIKKLIDLVVDHLSETIQNQFPDSMGVETAVICEYILKELD